MTGDDKHFEDLTGRDGYVIMQAMADNGIDPEALTSDPERLAAIAKSLYDFVRAQQALPFGHRQWSNEQDAIMILRKRMPELLEAMIALDIQHDRVPPTFEIEKVAEH